MSDFTAAAAPVLRLENSFGVTKQMEAFCALKTNMRRLAAIPGIQKLQSIIM
jgi:hypothetical protein